MSGAHLLLTGGRQRVAVAVVDIVASVGLFSNDDFAYDEDDNGEDGDGHAEGHVQGRVQAVVVVLNVGGQSAVVTLKREI